MRLPIIRSLTEYMESHDASGIEKTTEVLEHLSQARGLKDEELDVIGELISNLLGAIEVHQMVQDGQDKKDALNAFMKRVTGSIDR